MPIYLFSNNYPLVWLLVQSFVLPPIQASTYMAFLDEMRCVEVHVTITGVGEGAPKGGRLVVVELLSLREQTDTQLITTQYGQCSRRGQPTLLLDSCKSQSPLQA